MYTERFSPDFVCGVLIAAAERRRPALGAWSPATRKALHEVFVSELARIEERFNEVFDDSAYFDRLEKLVLEECFPRYCAVAEKQTTLEQKEYGLWRGGDLLARGAYMAGGLMFGLALVKLPFIPIPETWDFLILAAMLGGPFLPDAQVALHKRRYARTLKRIVKDMHDAEEAHRLYESLTPAQDRIRADVMSPPETAPGALDGGKRSDVREK